WTPLGDSSMPFAPPRPDARELEIVVREPASGLVLLQIGLRFTGFCSTQGALSLSPQPSQGGCKDAALPQSEIAGRIDMPPPELSRTIAAWLDHLRALKKKPRSIHAFRQVVEAAVAACGWTKDADLTFEAITSYMASKRN